MVRVLHFADAHIDIAISGRHDPVTGLPVRVMDFLKSLDEIVDTAISEKVDLVLFAGDAYKDRTPAPTFQREWGRRIMRLSRAGIPTLLLVGNHDLSPALGRAHALENFDTLDVPHVKVVDKPVFLEPADLGSVPVQVLALPWISRSGMVAHLGLQASTAQVYDQIERRLFELLNGWLEERLDPALPAILTAHCSVEGALYGGERTVMLGRDLVVSPSLVKDSRLDYVALGHIHKAQDLNEGAHPPVIYPGSIERVDFGEAADDKFFVIASIERGKTQVEWRKLKNIRPFYDRKLLLTELPGITDRVRQALPAPGKMKDAIVRLVLEYPRELEPSIDEASLREYTSECLEFHLLKRPQVEGRIRLPGDQAVGSLSHLELLDIYLRASHADPQAAQDLLNLADRLMHEPRGG